ncbi:MAG: NFACT family protein [Candidatus Riflebacteria bacterium]|nr:NFACT family protein [Candidatus Riflebacteria bacterium]
MDALLLRALVHEINPRLAGSRIERLHQPDDQSLLVRVFPPRNTYLMIGVSRRGPTVGLTSTKPDCPPAPLGFCQLLRARLEGGTVDDLSCVTGDRICRLRVRAQTTFVLVAEMFGPAPDVYLVDECSGRVLGHLRRGSLPRRMAGGIYAPPVPSAPVRAGGRAG